MSGGISDTMTKKKQPYVKPEIHKIETGAANKYGTSPYYTRKVRTQIDGVSIEDLTREFGSPLFVFSEKTIRKTIRDARDTFATYYPKVTFGWSYKTNYLDAICSIFHQEGSVAEVVSEMEYEKACRLGAKPSEIIYNGPMKSYASLLKAAADGARIHIDHFDEIQDLEKVADELGRSIDVGIRINLDTNLRPQWFRFGFNLESGQAMDAVQRIKMGGKLNLTGLHSHLATFVITPEAYQLQVEKMISFGYEIEDKHGFKIEYYDFGGGFPSKSNLKGLLHPPEISIPPLDTYAEKISAGLYGSLRSGDLPDVYLESGRFLIDEAGFLITTVRSSKRFPNGQKSYVLDAGVNLLYTSTWYKFTVELDRELQGMGEVSILNGPLCMNIDVVDDAVILPPLKRDMRLILSPVGAYNVTQWMQFIEYRPAIVLINEDGVPELIRRRETLEDMTANEILPDRLKL